MNRTRRSVSGGQSARQGVCRPGVTLLELIVVIALLGLVLGLAAPAFIVPSERSESGLNAVVGRARRAAVLRGEPVTLTFDGRSWRIDADATRISESIAAGSLDSPVGTFRVHVSPLGTCMPVESDRANAGRWDALDCRLDTAAEARGR